MASTAPDPAPTPIPVEPGYLTTEFWSAQATSFLTLIFAVGTDFGWFSFTEAQRHDITAAALFVIGAVQVGYAISRGLRKQGQ